MVLQSPLREQTLEGQNLKQTALQEQDLKVQVLVSAVNEDVKTLSEKMNIETDAVIVNQCDRYDYQEFYLQPETESAVNAERVIDGNADKDIDAGRCRIRGFFMTERGVGLSRNTALMHADERVDICLFSDEDIILEKGYSAAVRKAYEQYPDADLILFNVRVAPARRTYWNEKAVRVHWYNYGRYPAYSISGKTESLRYANVSFSLLFGGGAKYSNGEDSLFLRDCLRAGLKIYAVPVCIGEEFERESTWFHGYNEKFFMDRGVLYHYLYGKFAKALAYRFLYKHKEEMCEEISFARAYQLIKEGIKSQRKQR